MKLPIKMYIFIFICASVVLYQYHLSKAWIIFQNNSHDINLDTVKYEVKVLATTSSQQPCIINNHDVNVSNLPTLYIITPTYRRQEQLAELTRIAHTLMLVPNIHWLVIEDADNKTQAVSELLLRTNLSYDYLLAPMPAHFKSPKYLGPKPRGVSNRNKGISWIRKNAKKGVLYFADDDNTYDLRLFNEIRYTKRVSMFPVGLITKLGVSTPVIRHGKFAGFYDGWPADRIFPCDMASFAVNVEFLHSRPNAKMPYYAGYEEDGFLRSLRPFEPRELELLADNCTKILVWHTQTKKNGPAPNLNSKYNDTNVVVLRKLLVT